MSNILQVTQPKADVKIRPREELQNQKLMQNQVKNAVNPNRVQRADGQEAENAKTSTDKEKDNIDFKSNLATFLRTIEEDGGVKKEVLSKGALFSAIKEVFESKTEMKAFGKVLEENITLTNKEDIEAFLEEYIGRQMKFSGDMFDGLKSLLKRDISGYLKQTILEFLKAYNNFTSGKHLLNQMKTVGEDMSELMLKSKSEEFLSLLSMLDFDAENGMTSQNTAILNQKIIPYISDYISYAHDFGSIRDAGVLFVLYASKYENGSAENLDKIFEQMKNCTEFRKFFPNDPETALVKSLEKEKQAKHKGICEDLFAEGLREGSLKEGSGKVKEVYKNMISSMLLNESVHMPCMHTVFSFIYNQREVDSEIWYMPEEKNGKDNKPGRTILKFNIENIGEINLVAWLKNREIDVDLYIPKELMLIASKADRDVEFIFERNGFKNPKVNVKESLEKISLQSVFPEILTKGRGINVRI